MTEKEILENQIKEATLRLKLLEEQEKNSERDLVVKKITEYTSEEKIAFFDKLYYSAETELDSLIQHGYINESNEHYAWEFYIEILARNRRKFWDYWNKMER